MKTILITGCSAGIGKSLAKEFHNHGHKVYACARRLHKMNDLAELGIKTFQLDVTNQESVDNLKSSLESELSGKLDILYNNAGSGMDSIAASTPIDAAKDTFEVNYFGPVRMINAFIPWIIASKGMIVSTGTVAADLKPPWISQYAASKNALRSHMLSLRRELKPYGVAVVEVNTASVYTEIQDGWAQTKASKDSGLAASNEALAYAKKMTGGLKKQTADEYAKKVVPKVLKQTKSGQLLEGQNSWTSIIMAYWVPTFVSDMVLSNVYKLNLISESIKQEEKKRK